MRRFVRFLSKKVSKYGDRHLTYRLLGMSPRQLGETLRLIEVHRREFRENLTNQIDQLDRAIYECTTLKAEETPNEVERPVIEEKEDQSHPVWFYLDQIDKFDNSRSK